MKPSDISDSYKIACLVKAGWISINHDSCEGDDLLWYFDSNQKTNRQVIDTERFLPNNVDTCFFDTDDAYEYYLEHQADKFVFFIRAEQKQINSFVKEKIFPKTAKIQLYRIYENNVKLRRDYVRYAVAAVIAPSILRETVEKAAECGPADTVEAYTELDKKLAQCTVYIERLYEKER